MSISRDRLVLIAKVAAAVLFAAIAVNVLASEFGSTSWSDVSGSLSLIGWESMGWSLFATVIAFAALTPYDTLALTYAGRSLSLSCSAVSSTTTYAISNLLGFPLFTGNALRFWFFDHWGLRASDVVIAAIVTTIVCNVVLAIIAGASLIMAPGVFELAIGLPVAWGAAIGIALLAGGLALAMLGIAGPRAFRIFTIDFQRPGLRLIPHMAVCVVDYSATAAVFYVLLGDKVDMDFVSFVALFATAKTVGIMSNVPGGLGVFEAVIATTMNSVSAADLAAALIVYRCIFYLAPFAVATAVVAGHALGRASRRTSPRQPSTPSH